MSTRERLYQFILKEGTGKYKSKTLQDAGGMTEWGRELRQLRQDGVIRYNYSNKKKLYEITSINDYKASTNRKGLTNKIKYISMANLSVSLRD